MSFYHKNLGLTLFTKGDLERALVEYEIAIQNNEMNAENYFNRGNLKLKKEQFDEAHADFELAIQLEDQNAKFYHAKGLTYQAEAELEAQKQQPDNEFVADKVNSAIIFF